MLLFYIILYYLIFYDYTVGADALVTLTIVIIYFYVYIYIFSYDYCNFLTKMNINMVNICVIDEIL